jgi:SAM-dependent methyltransferase
MNKKNLEKQVISKQRVADHGEVYTSEREVRAMLNLVRSETERIDSRFLEPACGTGNFLVEVLWRKLRVVAQKYSNMQLEYERNAVLAVSSLYGIDILADNIQVCRDRLFEVFFRDFYDDLFEDKVKEECCRSVKYILECNIIQGDALTLKTVGESSQPIVFAEWSLVNGSFFKRRDFTFKELLDQESMNALPLFSDEGEKVFIPTPIKDYELVHFLEIANVQGQSL